MPRLPMSKQSLHCLATILCAISALGAQRPSDMQLRLRPGEKRCYRYIEESRQCGEGKGNECSFAESLCIDVSCEILGVTAEGAAEARITILRIVLTARLADGRLTAQDSADPGWFIDEPDAGIAFRELCGHGMRGRLAADGELLELDGCEALLAKANGWGSASITCNRLLDAGKLRRVAASLFGALPDRPMAPGGEWRRLERQGLGCDLQLVDTTWRFGKVGEGQVELLGVGRVTKVPAEAEADGLAAGPKDCVRREQCAETCRQIVANATGWTLSLDRHRTQSVRVAWKDAVWTFHDSYWTRVEPIQEPASTGDGRVAPVRR